MYSMKQRRVRPPRHVLVELCFLSTSYTAKNSTLMSSGYHWSSLSLIWYLWVSKHSLVVYKWLCDDKIQGDIMCVRSLIHNWKNVDICGNISFGMRTTKKSRSRKQFSAYSQCRLANLGSLTEESVQIEKIRYLLSLHYDIYLQYFTWSVVEKYKVFWMN